MLVPLTAWVYGAIGLAGATGLGIGGYAYASRWPASQIFGGTLIAPRRPGELALTFDDGPNPQWTPRLLDLLAEHNVHATFFMVGKFAKTERSLALRVVEAGHLLGNHTWSHPNLSRASASQVLDELSRTNDLIGDIMGKPVRFFRPPFGARRPYILKLARQLGLTPVMWNSMANDWSDQPADRIAASLTHQIDHNQSRGYASNIVLHDGGHLALGANRGPSVAAAAQLLERYHRNNTFVTLDAWQ
ncbi:MAG TPA: polysaccharide deacetylase family protein [Terracidiphilus sp.]|jgi:peptidoglycan/xylan/chitin deacetylase (PgdA/CDA1 family)